MGIVWAVSGGNWCREELSLHIVMTVIYQKMLCSRKERQSKIITVKRKSTYSVAWSLGASGRVLDGSASLSLHLCSGFQWAAG